MSLDEQLLLLCVHQISLCLIKYAITYNLFSGLVSKVFPADKLVDETVKLADKISSHSPLIVSLCKEAVNTALETSLQEGLHFEKRAFHATFATVSKKNC